MSDYKTTVRFSAEELLILRKAARDAPLTTYIRKGIIRLARWETGDGRLPGGPWEADGQVFLRPGGGGKK